MEKKMKKKNLAPICDPIRGISGWGELIWEITIKYGTKPHSDGSCEKNHYTLDRQFEKNYNEAKGHKSTRQSLAEAVFAANNIRLHSGFSLLQVPSGRQPILPPSLRPETSTNEVIQENPWVHASTPHRAREGLALVHKVRGEYRRIETGKKLENLKANKIAEYQYWRYCPGDQVDFFKNTVKPKRKWVTIVQKISHTQYKVRYNGGKKHKGKHINHHCAGSYRRRPSGSWWPQPSRWNRGEYRVNPETSRSPNENLDNQEVGIDTKPSQHIQENPKGRKQALRIQGSLT